MLTFLLPRKRTCRIADSRRLLQVCRMRWAQLQGRTRTRMRRRLSRRHCSQQYLRTLELHCPLRSPSASLNRPPTNAPSEYTNSISPSERIN